MAQTKIFTDQIVDPVQTKTGATGTVVHDVKQGAIFHHSSIAANFTANFTNVPTTNNRAVTLVFFLIQGAAPYAPTAVQIDGVSQTINWANGTAPTPAANKKEVAAFTLVRTGSAWLVLGNYSTYGA